MEDDLMTEMTTATTQGSEWPQAVARNLSLYAQMLEAFCVSGQNIALPPPKHASALLPARLVPSGVLGRGMAAACWLSDGSRAAMPLLTVSMSCAAVSTARQRI